MAQALRAATRAATAKTKADAALRAAIVEALDSGASLRQVARAVGLSHVRIAQIRDEQQS